MKKIKKAKLSVSGITPQDLKTILLQVAEAIQKPNAFNSEAMSHNADGKPCDIFSPEATKLDLLGWIIKFSYQQWPEMRRRKDIGHLVSMYIDSHIRTVSNEGLRLMTLSDAGPVYAAQYLNQAAEHLSETQLPILFGYGKDYESEEDKKKRQEKTAARKEVRMKKQKEAAP
jgi:hypothetical protein